MLRLRVPSVAIAATAAVLLAAPVDGSAATARKCGFAPVAFRTITDLRGTDCAGAKRILLRLRGERDTIPMVCARPTDLHGWHLRPGLSSERAWSSVRTRYSRGDVSFVYTRLQRADRVWCPPLEPVGEGV